MKIRNGFVSTSSSSSFVMIVNKDHYKEAIKDLKDIQVKFLEDIKVPAKFAGTDVFTFSIVDNMGYSNVDSFMEGITFEYDKDSEEGEERYDQDESDVLEATGDLQMAITKRFGDGNVITLVEDF